MASLGHSELMAPLTIKLLRHEQETIRQVKQKQTAFFIFGNETIWGYYCVKW